LEAQVEVLESSYARDAVPDLREETKTTNLTVPSDLNMFRRSQDSLLRPRDAVERYN